MKREVRLQRLDYHAGPRDMVIMGGAALAAGIAVDTAGQA